MLHCSVVCASGSGSLRTGLHLPMGLGKGVFGGALPLALPTIHSLRLALLHLPRQKQ